ncbi:unnamed protein product [Absidia cylindrospora]
MTKNDQVEQRFEVSMNDTQQQQRPFHIVLVDIKKTVESETVHCVERPLQDDDLNYVALSYRWGELEETFVDTTLGYTASITSFHLEHFIQLCQMILLETDLRAMDYVWVDAICVDQTNHERRKATIYQMSSIYERANYILAVPDLHLQHLMDTNRMNRKIIHGSRKYGSYIYHLLRGNTEQLISFEEELLDRLQLPRETRKWLTKYTDYFMEAFMEYRPMNRGYQSEEALDHIYQVSQVVNKLPQCKGRSHVFSTSHKLNGRRFCDVCQGIHCDNPDCPIYLFECSTSSSPAAKHQWKQDILERNISIRQSMHFLQDLIVDWSSRVWVISEYNIAKKKNNLRYWFIQLQDPSDIESDFRFFKFDMDGDDAIVLPQKPLLWDMQHAKDIWSDAVYSSFHESMIDQLKDRTFLEMILKSRASKCEDRFYAVLPISKYKDRVLNSWNINNDMVSVKLKLFEWMDPLDKIDLFFLTTNEETSRHCGHIFPTFATAALHWGPTGRKHMPSHYDPRCLNFNLADESAMTLHPNNDDDDFGGSSFLNLKPKEYYDFDGDIPQHPRFRQLVKIQSFATDAPFIIYFEYSIYLLGNFEENKWILASNWHPKDADHYSLSRCSDDFAGFNIY